MNNYLSPRRTGHQVQAQAMIWEGKAASWSKSDQILRTSLSPQSINPSSAHLAELDLRQLSTRTHLNLQTALPQAYLGRSL